MSSVKKVIGNNILVKKIEVAQKSIIAMPESTVQKTLLATVVKTGSDCELLKENEVCLFNPYGVSAKLDNGYFIVTEKEAIAVRVNNIFRPVGNRILVKRINNTDIKTKGGIIIQQCTSHSDQTLYGFVVALGYKNGKIVDFPLEPADYIKIAKWDKSIKEVEIERDYYLSVPFSLIELKCDQEFISENFIK